MYDNTSFTFTDVRKGRDHIKIVIAIIIIIVVLVIR